MENKKIKWLIYTVLVGLIPILLRLLVWWVTKRGTVELFNASDFVAFGLILHISNINAIENISPLDRSWKTIQNGTSITFIAFYSVLFALTLLSNLKTNIVDSGTITKCTIALSFISFCLSYSVFHRISKFVEGK